jgi:maltooligosyltrehalose trehalohydrolase
MLMKRDHVTSFGAEIVDGAVSYRLWAPNQDSVAIVLNEGQPQSMRKSAGGWHEFTDSNSQAGTLYRFQLEDGTRVPDPASRYQPSDIHGPSEVIDPRSYQWCDSGWLGRPWEHSVIYELHVGTFTAAGTFRSAIERLDWLVDLGVTAIELMPVADFPGVRNWGYDGVLLFAPDASYGRPEDLKALVDAAHARNLMVFLDVVYNHFGPDGNYLSAYSPIFTEAHHTPWGAAVNYDDEGSEVVRQFVIQNAIYWIEEFHLDGLRLDAVHAIKDDSELHVLEEIAQRIRSTVAKPVHLILENEENEASRLGRNQSLEPIHYTAQWNDDVHHVLHCAATGETAGYYAEYAGDTEKLGRALAEGFAFQGDLMKYRGKPRGEPSSSLPPTAFIAFIQNHDQVGNRAFGDRLLSVASPEAVRAVAAIYLLLPQIPMLFMGEEFGASQPFPFFCHFEPELAKLVCEGRRNEFAKFPEFQDPQQRERIPDPTAEQTFQSAKLDWDEATRDGHAGWVRLYRELLAIRHREIIPRLFGIGGNSGQYEVLGDAAVRVSWQMGDGARLHLVANLSDRVLQHADAHQGRQLWSTGETTESSLGPWSVIWAIEAAADNAGSRT